MKNPVNQMRKYWLLTNEQYERLRNVPGAIPPDIDLNILRTKFLEDKVRNQIEADSNWGMVTDRIRPILQGTSANSTPPPPPPPAPPPPPPAAAVNPMELPPESSPLSLPPPLSPIPTLPQASTPRRPATAGATAAAAAAVSPLGVDSNPWTDDESMDVSPLQAILEEVPRSWGEPVAKLYAVLQADSRIKIDDKFVYVYGKKCRGSAAELLLNLCKPMLSLRYNNPDLLRALAQIPNIVSYIANEKAIETIAAVRTQFSPGIPGVRQSERRDLKGSGKIRKKKIRWKSLF